MLDRDLQAYGCCSWLSPWGKGHPSSQKFRECVDVALWTVDRQLHQTMDAQWQSAMVDKWIASFWTTLSSFYKEHLEFAKVCWLKYRHISTFDGFSSNFLLTVVVPKGRILTFLTHVLSFCKSALFGNIYQLFATKCCTCDILFVFWDTSWSLTV